MTAMDDSAADEPIDARYRELMNALAHALDDVLGGLGFALVVFEFNRIEGGRINYISNADRADMMTALREFVADREQRARS